MTTDCGKKNLDGTLCRRQVVRPGDSCGVEHLGVLDLPGAASVAAAPVDLVLAEGLPIDDIAELFDSPPSESTGLTRDEIVRTYGSVVGALYDRADATKRSELAAYARSVRESDDPAFHLIALEAIKGSVLRTSAAKTPGHRIGFEVLICEEEGLRRHRAAGHLGDCAEANIYEQAWRDAMGELGIATEVRPCSCDRLPRLQSIERLAA